MKYVLHYRQGHPAGYTDDLGIIADRNQWVEEELTGWYCFMPYVKDVTDIKQWCEKNLADFWRFHKGMLYIYNDNDATLFNLTWG